MAKKKHDNRERINQYFGSEDEAQQALRQFANNHRPLVLPDPEQLAVVAAELERISNSQGGITPGAVIHAYLSLQASLALANIICSMPDPSDPTKLCGGDMDISVDWKGAFYQCRLHPSTHRIPV